MSFATASKKKEDVESGGSGGKYINGSGMFDVEILAGFVSTGKNGSKSVDFFVDHNDQSQVIYGNLRVSNNDGSDNVIGCKTFNQLLLVADIENVDDPIDAELPIGKKGANKPAQVLEDIVDIPVTVRIQREYSTWNGNIMESDVIKGFYRTEDKASAEEIVNETEPGLQYAQDLDYVQVKYDGVTEEEVKEWIKGGRKKGGNTSTAKKAPGFTKKPGFGKKKEG